MLFYFRDDETLDCPQIEPSSGSGPPDDGVASPQTTTLAASDEKINAKEGLKKHKKIIHTNGASQLLGNYTVTLLKHNAVFIIPDDGS